MIDDETLEPVEPLEDDELGVDGEVKKKDLIDEDTESLDDLEDDELEEEEEPFDDITNT